MPMKQLCPVPEACAGSLCANCLQYKTGLKCCTRCKRSWYCNAECQKQHWPQHKAPCKAAAPIIAALTEHILQQPMADSYATAISPITDADLDCSTGTSVAPIDPLVRSSVSKMIKGTVFCSRCFKIREQLPAEQRNGFRCCPKCHWGWCCSDSCWQANQTAHNGLCPTFKRMSDCQLLAYKHVTRPDNPGNRVLNWCQMGKVPAGRAGRLASSWEQYKQQRQAPAYMSEAWDVITESLSIPLTAVLATTKLYSKQQLSTVTEFTLHLVGASDYEWQSVGMTSVVEEIMHQLPAVKHLRVLMAGPDITRLLHHDEAYTDYDTDCCPPCEQEGCKRTYAYYRGRYEDYAASPQYKTPTLALCCNSGVGCDTPVGKLSWLPAVRALLEKGTPTCFTSYQEKEAQEDLEALRAASAHIVCGPEVNPFRGEVPYWDRDEGPDKFYRMNAYYMCVKGKVVDA